MSASHPFTAELSLLVCIVAPPLSSLTDIWCADGYNLGQLRLSGCKLHPYDNDLKIPMTIRGPGIAPGSVFSHVGENLDLAPTFLDLAGIKGAGDMDGQSLLAQLLSSKAPPTRVYTYHEFNSLGNYSVNNGLDDDPTSVRNASPFYCLYMRYHLSVSDAAHVASCAFPTHGHVWTFAYVCRVHAARQLEL